MVNFVGNCVVKVKHGDKTLKTVKQENMVVIGASEIIADAMTMSPSLCAIETASSLLDTSNYTVQAMSLGKGYDYYDKFQHSLEFSSIKLENAGTGAVLLPIQEELNIQIQTGLETSSYTSSSVSAIKIPEAPYYTDTRLQRSSTLTPYQDPDILAISDPDNIAYSDVGHNLNFIQFVGNLSQGDLGFVEAMIGCYCISSALYVTGIGTNGILGGPTYTTSVASGLLNYGNNVDRLGFIELQSTSVAHGATLKSENEPSSGLVHTSAKKYNKDWDSAGESNFSGTHGLGQLAYHLTLSSGDFLVPLCFGGIQTMGLWGLDAKRMAQEGYAIPSPPQGFDEITTNPPKRLYKLIAKLVFLEDLLMHDEDGYVFNTYSWIPSGVGSQVNQNQGFLDVEWRLDF